MADLKNKYEIETDKVTKLNKTIVDLKNTNKELEI
jgi:hypothetical protein